MDVKDTTRFLSFTCDATKPCPDPNPSPVEEERRSANYHPTIWNTKLIQSLTTSYSYETHGDRLEELKKEAKALLLANVSEGPFEKLELIDSIQRLGLAYHFQEEIKEVINLIQLDPSTTNLYITALHFRLLRENGFQISTDVFDKFRDGDGKFMETLSEDREGLLSLYEASHLGVIGEHVLDEAKDFSTKRLHQLMDLNPILDDEIKQSMEFPLRQRMPRLEVRNFIGIHKKNDKRSSSILLELAKLDYNIVQAIHQRELKDLQRLGFQGKAEFFKRSIGGELSVGAGHDVRARIICILSATDDMYDVYGTPDELEVFTDAINRWDTKDIDGMPEYMRVCYLAILNLVDEIADSGMKNSGLHIRPYLVQEWQKLCRAYMAEARWFHSNYTPTFDEYIKNGWTSIGGSAAMVHAMLSCPAITERTLDFFKHGRELVRCSSLIGRFYDDFGTSEAETVRGDVAKSVKCYMTQTGATEEEAVNYIKCLINELWKRLNEEIANDGNYLSKSFVNVTLNMARAAHCIFQYGDGIGTSTGLIKDRLISLIGEEIPMDDATIS